MEFNEIDIIEAPICTGSPTMGSEKAYSVFKENKIDRIFTRKVNYVDSTDTFSNDISYPNMSNYSMVVSASKMVREKTLKSLCSNNFPIIVGGDHSIAMGSIAAASEYYGVDNLAIIYIDGHTDINTEKTTLTGYIHGMPLASSLGICDKKLQIGPLEKKVLGDNIYIIGARSIDDAEYTIIDENNVNLITAKELINGSIDGFLIDVSSKLIGKKVHISFDVDSIDKSEFKSTGYLIDGGLGLGNIKKIIKFFMKNLDVVSLDVVEYNPTMDENNEDYNKLVNILNLGE